MTLRTKRDIFLSNSVNKQNFIDSLCEKLEHDDVKTLKASGDADLLIAQTGVNRAQSGSTHVIGEDTDLLVLRLHHAKPKMHNLVFRSDKHTKLDKKSKVSCWNINLIR